jgi:hypothetical protein
MQADLIHHGRDLPSASSLSASDRHLRREKISSGLRRTLKLALSEPDAIELMMIGDLPWIRTRQGKLDRESDGSNALIACCEHGAPRRA